LQKSVGKLYFIKIVFIYYLDYLVVLQEFSDLDHAFCENFERVLVVRVMISLMFDWRKEITSA